MTYGQVFGAYAGALARDLKEIESAGQKLLEIPLGGTAVGTGIASHPRFKKTVAAKLRNWTGLDLKPGKTIELTQNFNPFANASASLRSLALTLARVSRNLQFLSSGPAAGIGEIVLPEVEPGSSIMPGKVNPSVPECVEMIALDVLGADHTIALAAQAGYNELNTNSPLIAHKLLNAIEILTNGCAMFEEHCVRGLRVNEKRCRELVDKSAIVATALNPYLGYSVTSKIVREAQRAGKTIARVVEEKGLMTRGELARILKPENLTKPSKPDAGLKKKAKERLRSV